MPQHIHGTDIHTYDKDAKQHRSRNFLAGGNFARGEVYCGEDKRQRAAIEYRKPLHTHGVVGCRKKLYDDVKDIEVFNWSVVGIRERKFAVGERFVHGENHKAAHKDCRNRRQPVHQRCAADLTEAFVLAFSRNHIIQKIQR